MNKLLKPPKSILDSTFRYVPAASTNIRKTFRRVRKELGLREPEKVIPFPMKKEN